MALPSPSAASDWRQSGVSLGFPFAISPKNFIWTNQKSALSRRIVSRCLGRRFSGHAYAVFLCRQRRFDDAVKQFDRALKITSHDTSHVIYTNAGACMTQKPDFEQAELYFRSALKERPIHGEALIQMAALQFKKKECLQSRAFLQRFLANNTTSPGVLYLGVQVEECLENNRAETDYMNQLQSEFPDSPEARRVAGAD